MSSWSGTASLPLPSSSPLYSSFSRLLCGERSPPFTLAGPLVPNVQCSFLESTHLPGFHSSLSLSLSLSLTVTLILELQCDIVLMFCDLPQENQALGHSHGIGYQPGTLGVKFVAGVAELGSHSSSWLLLAMTLCLLTFLLLKSRKEG